MLRLSSLVEFEFEGLGGIMREAGLVGELELVDMV
jgi:hypothetical protein